MVIVCVGTAFTLGAILTIEAVTQVAAMLSALAMRRVPEPSATLKC